jgi:hypothetical protein
MKRMLGCCGVVIILLISSVNLFAQSSKVLRETSEPKIQGGVATLYALDPLAHTFCFRDGQDGYVVQQSEIRNRCNDLEFNSYKVGGFTVGNEGGRIGNIIDLGAADELKQKYGYEESSLATGQGFISLRVENGKVVILKDRKAQTVQELMESKELFMEGKSLAALPIKLGHIYLVRLTDAHDKSFQLLVKMVVVAYRPNESVTIRWQLL